MKLKINNVKYKFQVMEKSKKTKCYSVRIKSIYRGLSKNGKWYYKIEGFDGSKDFFPACAVKGVDLSVQKSDAYWIACWALEERKLQYSDKKSAWFDDKGNQLADYTVEHHTPTPHAPVTDNSILELLK